MACRSLLSCVEPQSSNVDKIKCCPTAVDMKVIDPPKQAFHTLGLQRLRFQSRGPRFKTHKIRRPWLVAEFYYVLSHSLQMLIKSSVVLRLLTRR